MIFPSPTSKKALESSMDSKKGILDLEPQMDALHTLTIEVLTD